MHLFRICNLCSFVKLSTCHTGTKGVLKFLHNNCFVVSSNKTHFHSLKGNLQLLDLLKIFDISELKSNWRLYTIMRQNCFWNRIISCSHQHFPSIWFRTNNNTKVATKWFPLCSWANHRSEVKRLQCKNFDKIIVCTKSSLKFLCCQDI